MLTKTQRKRLAVEARKLAMECVEGTAPKFGHGFISGARACAIGVATRRVYGRGRYIDTGEHNDNDTLDEPLDDAMWAVIDANDDAEEQDRHAAVVFPLLALADVLDAA